MPVVQPRRYRCTAAACPQFGHEWTVEPREVQPGLVTFDEVVCAGCGYVPPLVA